MSKLCAYYFSPNSPWCYLGHQRFMQMAKKYAIKVELKPCNLAKVLASSGGLPLAQRAPQRQAYRLTEMQRWSEHLAIPMHLQPAFFPVVADPAALFIIATQLAHGNDIAMQLSEAILRAVWAEQKNIADPAVLVGLAFDLELDGKALLKTSETASVEKEYQRHTSEMIAANGFGVPWFVYNGENFWGQDRLDFLERAFQTA